MDEKGALPKLAHLEPCSHRHLTLLFLLEPDGEVAKMLGSCTDCIHCAQTLPHQLARNRP